MITVQTELVKAFAYWKLSTGISDQARAIFLRQKEVFTVKGAVSDYFFIEQQRDQTSGETTVYLRLLNTDIVRDLLQNSTAVVVRDLNPLYDDFIFNLGKQETVPSEGFAILRRLILPTSKKYTGAG